MDIIKQCEIAFIRLIRLAGLSEADIECRAAQIVAFPDAVREAYRPLYARGTAIVALSIEARGVEADEAVEAARKDVLRLLDHMRKGGL